MSTKFWLVIGYIILLNMTCASASYRRGGRKLLVAFIEGQLIAFAIVSSILLSSLNG